MPVFFDVGANNGEWSIPFAQKNLNSKVYAFEPTPHMCNIIRSSTIGLKNYYLTEKAVSNFEDFADFKIAGQADWGCSSLLDFSDKSKTDWPGRNDFKVTQTIRVEVIRLDRFIEQEQIEEIDYLHVDTQGSDLKVLIGMGDRIYMVKRGVIEAAAKKDVLYFGQNTKDECVEFLTSKGFTIENVIPNDPMGNEVNIEFKLL